jgi:hypothetical protein
VKTAMTGLIVLVCASSATATTGWTSCGSVGTRVSAQDIRVKGTSCSTGRKVARVYLSGAGDPWFHRHGWRKSHWYYSITLRHSPHMVVRFALSGTD